DLILRHLFLGDRLLDRADLRQNEIRQPVHARALRTPLLKALTSPSTASMRSGVALPFASSEDATRSTSAEPTTAASATFATAAACAGVRMPKPTATGSSVCFFSRVTAAVITSPVADLVPVTPATAT